MNTLKKTSPHIIFHEALLGAVRAWWKAFYRIALEPCGRDEDGRRRELILNVIISALLGVIFLLGLSVLYSDLENLDKVGFNIGAFSLFFLFFASLLALSRRGHADLASYLFIGMYFLATTYGVYVWGTAVPITLISYGAIIVISSLIMGTKKGAIVAATIALTLIGIGFMQTQGVITSDLSWRKNAPGLKDVFEDVFVFGIIVVASWLSNREIERSLLRARASERALKAERDLLEVKVEERTKELKAVELEKVAQLYRFVEFGRLSSGIFHDLLNPLSVVALSVEKLGDGAKEEQRDTRECIERAIRASKRMEAFMQTARKQLDSREKKQTFSADREVRDAIDLLLHKSRRAGVEIGFTGSMDAVLYGDPVKFFQVAVNLISNAIDSYADAPERSTKIVSVSISSSPTDLRLVVLDTGCGIRADLQGSIFDPFFTTKQDRPRSECGFGLGLSTTKDVVERDFGGRIELESAPGRGSRFTVIIPRDEKTYGKTEPENTGGANDRVGTRGALEMHQK